MTRVVVGLGGNLGSRASMLRAATDLLAATPGVELRRVSPAYVTEALEGRGPPYLNAAALVETALALARLLERTLAIEAALGRVRSGRYDPRTVDLDLLWASEPVHDPPRLLVPHPALLERSFALGPLLDVAPELEGPYADALSALGGRPPDARPLEDRSDLDDWDRMAAELTRAVGGAAGEVPPGLEVRAFGLATPGLPAGYDEAERGVRELERAHPWRPWRVALGPAPEGGSTVYVVGVPTRSEGPE